MLICAIHLKYVTSFNVFGVLVCCPEFSQAPRNCISWLLLFIYFLLEAGIWVGLRTGQFCMFYSPLGSLKITVLSHLSTFVFYGQTTCSENVTFTCIVNRLDRSNITTFSCRQWTEGLKMSMGSRTFWRAAPNQNVVWLLEGTAAARWRGKEVQKVLTSGRVDWSARLPLI